MWNSRASWARGPGWREEERPGLGAHWHCPPPGLRPGVPTRASRGREGAGPCGLSADAPTAAGTKSHSCWRRLTTSRLAFQFSVGSLTHAKVNVTALSLPSVPTYLPLCRDTSACYSSGVIHVYGCGRAVMCAESPPSVSRGLSAGSVSAWVCLPVPCGRTPCVCVC